MKPISALEAAGCLGVGLDAGPDEIRQAYLAAVRRFPPERCPHEFERVRAAYDLLRDPRAAARAWLDSFDPQAPLTELLTDLRPERPYLGPEPWLKLMEVRPCKK